MARRRAFTQAPVQSAVLNYLRTAAWRGIGPVPKAWLTFYLYGRDDAKTQDSLRQIIDKLRWRGFPIRAVRSFGYVFEPAAAQPPWAELRNTSVTMSPAMPVMSAPAQMRISHHSERTEEIARSAVLAASSADDLMLP